MVPLETESKSSSSHRSAAGDLTTGDLTTGDLTTGDLTADLLRFLIDLHGTTLLGLTCFQCLG